MYCGPSAIPGCLSWNALAIDPEVRGRGEFPNFPEYFKFSCHGIHHIVVVVPLHERIPAKGSPDVEQPSPAFEDTVSGFIHLKKPLRPALIVYHYSIAFRESSGGYQDAGLLRGPVSRMIEYNNIFELAQKVVNRVGLTVTVQVCLQDN